jgi:hypothetical protein
MILPSFYPDPTLAEFVKRVKLPVVRRSDECKVDRSSLASAKYALRMPVPQPQVERHQVSAASGLCWLDLLGLAKVSPIPTPPTGAFS